MSLYHTYRPQTFAAIVGQDHVKQTLAAAVARGEVAHAYLFSGPRGIGKTSIARILAMAVNCAQRTTGLEERSTKKGVRTRTTSSVLHTPSPEPCGECSSCVAIRSGSDLRVVEIDAASNRGIDEIRALREAVAFAPGSGGRKVYIIDEVHMLTKEAFNALLKTLEEPPAHALFILATTELHRVPETIISRTQHFTFKRATMADTRAHLDQIAALEGLTIDREASVLIAEHADGAFRDALSLLDQLAALGERTITAEHVRLLLGVAPEPELIGLLAATFQGSPVIIHDTLERFSEHGYDPAALADALIGMVRYVLWRSFGVTRDTASEAMTQFAGTHQQALLRTQLMALIERLMMAKQQLRWSPVPFLPLELALLDPNDQGLGREEGAVVPHSVSQERQATSVTVPTKTIVSTTKTVIPATTSNQQSAISNGDATWSQILAAILPRNAQLAALLKSSKLVGIDAHACTIEVPFSFYADRVKDRKNAAVIAEVLEAVTGAPRTVRCVVAGSLLPLSGDGNQTAAPSVRSTEELVKDIHEVFGLEEVTSG